MLVASPRLLYLLITYCQLAGRLYGVREGMGCLWFPYLPAVLAPGYAGCLQGGVGESTKRIP